ncbi:hypothetical protein VM1G_08370 [Cytospora mali]|uniref:Uncharacterized protein n=1 Tax=Cytospora mali TaxID=578113 RepID=A0A194W9R9_CYTMA|nr:hypothetical protein VM1G_08370 [Valsa mali]
MNTSASYPRTSSQRPTMAFEKRNKKQLENQRQRQRPHPSPDTPCASAGNTVSSIPGPPSPPLSSSSSPTSLPPFVDVRPDELQALLCAAESAGIHKYRYDYEPSERLLALRMPEGAPRLFTKDGFARDKARALRSLKIAPNVEAEVKFPTGGERRPDVAFFYKGQRYPPLVVETGHSQKAVSLAGLARSYIRDTGAAIHTVVTAKFVYLTPNEHADVRRQRRQPRRVIRSQSRQRGSTEESMSYAARHSYLAHLSLYRLGKRVVHDQVFRDAQGKPTDGGLELSIADLVPWDDDGEVAAAGLGPLSRAELESLTFIVPFSELCEALTWGEEQQALEEQTPTPEFAARAGQKRVHFDDFDWSEPDEGQEEEDEHRDDGEDDEGHWPGRRSRSSKRRRMSADERPYRDRSSPLPEHLTDTNTI